MPLKPFFVRLTGPSFCLCYRMLYLYQIQYKKWHWNSNSYLFTHHNHKFTHHSHKFTHHNHKFTLHNHKITHIKSINYPGIQEMNLLQIKPS